MFEGLISGVLNRFLGNFIENLGAEQLNISLWNGQITLQDMQIKKTLFDSMPVPFNMHYGKVGKIYIDIPVINISTEPLKIELYDVFLFIKPKKLDEWKENVEVKAFKDSVQSSLDKYENYLQEKAKLD